jgi:CelD/BcsL family acetyltransferase involved in cellulose biosynthesis
MDLGKSSDSLSTKGRCTTSFNVRVSEKLADFADLWPSTSRSGTIHGYALQCSDVLQVWCNTIGKATGIDPLFVAVLDEMNRPILLLPFCIARSRGMRVLRFLDGGICDYNAPILFQPMRTWDRGSVKELWRELVRALPRFDIAMLDKMPAEIYGVPNPFIGLDVEPYRSSGHLRHITGTWEEYAESRLPYKRESVAQRRRLAKLGKLNFLVAESSSDRKRILEAMMRQKAQRYIETRGKNPIKREVEQFYIAMAERFTWPGPSLVAALELNGTTLATNWGLVFNNRFLGLVTSFEGGDWKRYSPGKLLLEDLLKWAFNNGIKVFDFGIGDEGYKLGYSDQSILVYQADIPVTLIGKAYVAARLLKRAVSRTIKRQKSPAS